MSSVHSSVEHYENFPVASRLVPKKYRSAIAAVYWFARSADDIADEGQVPTEERLSRLRRFSDGLKAIDQHQINLELEGDLQGGFTRLARVVQEYRLDTRHFYDLLSAFSQDANFTPLANDAALLDYCRRSANPVGRIVLGIYAQPDEALYGPSDAVCSALQLINFLQDLQPDAKAMRSYVPLSQLNNHQLNYEQWLNFLQDPAGKDAQIKETGRSIVAAEFERAQVLLNQGKALPDMIKGPNTWRLRAELRATIAGGQAILNKIKAGGFDPHLTRPRLGKLDWIKIAYSTLIPSA